MSRESWAGVAALTVYVVAFAADCRPTFAVTETQSFFTESAADAEGWIGKFSRVPSAGNDFGFSDSNESNGLGTGEAGGTFSRYRVPLAYYADLSIGHFTLSDTLNATGRIVFYQGNIDGGMRLGWFRLGDPNNPLPARAGVQINEGNRHQAVLVLNDSTGKDATLVAGGIGPISTTFSLNWNPATRIMTSTIGGVTTTTPAPLSDAQMTIGADFNAFGLYTSAPGTSNPSLRAQLFIDDLSYTSHDTTTVQMRINRFSGATRIVGVGGVAPIQLTSYTAGSNTANPPLENVWLPANWTSVTDQNGGGWSEVTSPTPNSQELSEANSTGSKTINPGISIGLGNIFNPAAATNDISFNYTLQGESYVRPGHVIFDGGLKIRVNKQSGNISIINSEAIPMLFDGYVIQSPSSALHNTSWHSLEEQSLSGWDAIESSSAKELSELNLSGSTIVPQGGGSLDLGAAYAGGIGGAEDLQFSFSLAGSEEIYSAEVSYVSSTLAGDYNQDGHVTAADYTVWRDTLNSMSDLRADGDNSGKVDTADYAIWKGQFGESADGGSGQSTRSVPEPDTVGLLLLGLASIGRPKRRG